MCSTITLSYAAFALALGIGHIALGKVIRGKKPEAALYNYLYRTLQVGVLLLATGTILGGVWANYSWGRFWDWDPKETWALITLLGYLFVLHGRIAGKWAGFGMAVGAVLAFQGVLMAWYGVNFVLGVGLHSYGFGTGGFGWALLFVAAEIGFVLLAVVRMTQSSPSLFHTAGNLQASTRIDNSDALLTDREAFLAFPAAPRFIFRSFKPRESDILADRSRRRQTLPPANPLDVIAQLRQRIHLLRGNLHART